MRQAYDVVLLAAGAWSRALLAPLGIAVPLPVRALQLLLTEPGPAALAPVLSAWGEPLRRLGQRRSWHWLGHGQARPSERSPNRATGDQRSESSKIAESSN